MENVSYRQAHMLLKTDHICPFLSWRREEHPLVCQSFDISILGIYVVVQFNNNRGYRYHAEIWASITGILLL